MAEKITTTIKNMATGEVMYEESYFFPNDATLTAIVLVKQVKYYHYHDSHLVSNDSLALGCTGSIFRLDIEYCPDSVAEKDNILADMIEGEIYFVKGKYCVADNIMLFEPSYKAMEGEMESEIREVFKINSAASLKAVQ